MNFQFNYFITMFLLVIGLPNFISAHENTTTCNNNWIKALIAETQPPDNIQQYANDIYQLAPNVERINLRVTLAGITTIEAYNQLVKKYQNLIKALYSVYGNHTISIGFHPDNSKSSAKYHIWWNPNNGNPNTQNCISWQCVMSNSIILMNKINAVFPSGKGFTEFSIEQSYLEPQDINDLRAEKSCLNGNAALLCPTGITLAEPAVSYGYVGPSYGDVSRYGPNDLDYGYPQYYNLESSFTFEQGQTTPDLPKSSTGTLQAGTTYRVVDANMGSKPYTGNILPLAVAQNRMQNTIYTSQNSTLVADYLAYLFSKKPLNSKPNDSNAEVFITLSGEPKFFGDTGWSKQNLCQFNQALTQTLQQQYDINTNNIKFAIWNFSALLGRN